MRKSQIYLNQGKKYKMKKILACALSLILCLSSISVTSSAGTIGDMIINTDVLEALKNADNIPFSPKTASIFDFEWLESSETRADLTVLLTLDLYFAGYPDACNGVMEYNSYVGKSEDMYIIAGMFEGHAFAIFYSPKEKAGVYRVASTTLDSQSIESSLEGVVFSCPKHYLNSKEEIISYYNTVTSSSN